MPRSVMVPAGGQLYVTHSIGGAIVPLSRAYVLRVVYAVPVLGDMSRYVCDLLNRSLTTQVSELVLNASLLVAGVLGFPGAGGLLVC